MKTKITELLGIEYPIIQGGMAWVAEYHRAAAVSEAGGLGIIGAASAPPDPDAPVITTKSPFSTEKVFISSASTIVCSLL